MIRMNDITIIIIATTIFKDLQAILVAWGILLQICCHICSMYLKMIFLKHWLFLQLCGCCLALFITAFLLPVLKKIFAADHYCCEYVTFVLPRMTILCKWILNVIRHIMEKLLVLLHVPLFNVNVKVKYHLSWSG